MNTYPKLNRNERSALKGVAIRAFAKAHPELTEAQLCRALGVQHITLRYHLQERGKTPVPAFSGWQNAFRELCGRLANADLRGAAQAANSLSKALA